MAIQIEYVVWAFLVGHPTRLGFIDDEQLTLVITMSRYHTSICITQEAVDPT